MKKQRFLLSILVGSAAFVYLIGAFLIATFNITLWSAGQRTFAIFIYLFIAGGALKSITESLSGSNPRQEDEIEGKEKEEAI